MATPSAGGRRAMLAKIHIAKKDLGLDDGTYRLMLDNLFGVDSSAKLTAKQLDELLGHLTGHGFTGRKGGAAAAPSDADKVRKPLLAKIHALLTTLGQLEERHVPWSYAAGILRRQSGVMRLEWATGDQLRAVVAALSKRIGKLECAADAARLTGEGR